MNIDVPSQGSKVQGQWKTDCKKAQEAALKCITDHVADRKKCDPLFAAYRACRKDEHARILKARGEGG